ncbi:hypothetical protein MADA3029_940050 [Vibrio nigripulchritudo MADA3029]|nr:hypothetical protein MADA3029_940050 [Vibrio nigripulchritudo MADA3029]
MLMLACGGNKLAFAQGGWVYANTISPLEDHIIGRVVPAVHFNKLDRIFNLQCDRQPEDHY